MTYFLETIPCDVCRSNGLCHKFNQFLKGPRRNYFKPKHRGSCNTGESEDHHWRSSCNTRKVSVRIITKEEKSSKASHPIVKMQSTMSLIL